MFRPLTGHHHCQVVHPMKRVGGLYNIQYIYIYNCTAPQPFSLDVQPDNDDGLLEAETCSC